MATRTCVCPLCGGEADRVAGAVSEVIWSAALARVARRVRPAVFWACAACEWCAERLEPTRC